MMDFISFENYIIIDKLEEGALIENFSEYSVDKYSKTMHVWNDKITSFLLAIRLLQHLPRSLSSVIEDYETPDYSCSNITILSCSQIDSYTNDYDFDDIHKVVTVIYNDYSKDAALKFSSKCKPIVEPINVSSIENGLITPYYIYNCILEYVYKKNSIIQNSNVFSEDQYNQIMSQEFWNYMYLQKEIQRSIVLSIPGIPKKLINDFNFSKQLSIPEEMAIEIMALNEAQKHKSYLIHFEQLESALFSKFKNIENGATLKVITYQNKCLILGTLCWTK